MRYSPVSLSMMTVLFLLLLCLSARRTAAEQGQEERPADSLAVELHDLPTVMPVYQPDSATASLPLIVLSSGDGGWRDFEHKNAVWLSGKGYFVAGMDAASYVKVPVTEDEVVDDFRTCFDAFRRTAGGVEQRRIVLMGYSLGAELVALLSAHLEPSDGVAGLVLIGPSERGSVKIRATTSPSRQYRAFILRDLLANRRHLPVLFLHGELDRISAAPKLFESLEEPKRLSVIEDAGHLFTGAHSDYLEALSAGLEWIAVQDSKNEAR